MSDSIDLEHASEDEEKISKQEAIKMLRIQERMHKRELKKLRAEHVVTPPIEIKPEIDKEFKENQIMNATDLQTAQADAANVEQQITGGQTIDPAAQGQPVAPAAQGVNPADSQGAPIQAPQEQQVFNIPSFESLPPEMQAQMMVVAMQKVKDEERQQVIQRTQEQIQADKQRIISEFDESLKNDPSYKQAFDNFEQTYPAEQQSQFLASVLDLTVGDQDAPAVIQKLLSSKELMNQYVSMDGDPFGRTKLLNGVKTEVISDRIASMPSGNKGTFYTGANSTPTKSIGDMNDDEYKAYAKKNNMY